MFKVADGHKGSTLHMDIGMPSAAYSIVEAVLLVALA